jgi:hypothetical protein
MAIRPLSVPQRTAAEFAAALKAHGFRVVNAKIEEPTGRCPGIRLNAVLRGWAVDRNRTLAKVIRNATPRSRGGTWPMDGRPDRRPDRHIPASRHRPSPRLARGFFSVRVAQTYRRERGEVSEAETFACDDSIARFAMCCVRNRVLRVGQNEPGPPDPRAGLFCARPSSKALPLRADAAASVVSSGRLGPTAR